MKWIFIFSFLKRIGILVDKNKSIVKNKKKTRIVSFSELIFKLILNFSFISIIHFLTTMLNFYFCDNLRILLQNSNFSFSETKILDRNLLEFFQFKFSHFFFYHISISGAFLNYLFLLKEMFLLQFHFLDLYQIQVFIFIKIFIFLKLSCWDTSILKFLVRKLQEKYLFKITTISLIKTNTLFFSTLLKLFILIVFIYFLVEALIIFSHQFQLLNFLNIVFFLKVIEELSVLLLFKNTHLYYFFEEIYKKKEKIDILFFKKFYKLKNFYSYSFNKRFLIIFGLIVISYFIVNFSIKIPVSSYFFLNRLRYKKFSLIFKNNTAFGFNSNIIKTFYDFVLNDILKLKITHQYLFLLSIVLGIFSNLVLYHNFIVVSHKLNRLKIFILGSENFEEMQIILRNNFLFLTFFTLISTLILVSVFGYKMLLILNLVSILFDFYHNIEEISFFFNPIKTLI